MKNIKIDLLSDDQLLNDLTKGSSLALKKLMLRYEEQVYQFALKLLKSPPLAQEIAQDVFIKLWEDRSKATHIRSVSAWLYTITKHKALNLIKETDSRLLREDHYATVKPSEVQGENEIILRDYKTLLIALIDQMPAKRKEVFKLKLDEGLSNDEIASLLNISSHTVKNHVTKSYLFIRRALSYHFLLALILTLL